MPTETKLVETGTIVTTNPATGEVLAELACASPDDVRNAVLRAKAAQPSWQATPVGDRIALLRRFQQLLTDRRDQVASLICREAGKPAVEALMTEVLVVLDAAGFCIRNAHRFLREQPLPHGNPIMKTKRGTLVREPYGVIGIIAPWNYPFSIPAVETLGALVTGNAVVLKPSELTPLVALELQKLLLAAGLHPDLMQVVVGEGPAGAALLESPIDKLIFTGSVATGKRVGEAAARRLLPVVLELGGKDPMLVLDDADLGYRLQRRALGLADERRSDLPLRRALLRASQHLRGLPRDLPPENRQAPRGQRNRFRGGDGTADQRAPAAHRRGASARRRTAWRAPAGGRKAADLSWARISTRPLCSPT